METTPTRSDAHLPGSSSWYEAAAGRGNEDSLVYFSLTDSPVSEAAIVGLTLLLGATSAWTAFQVDVAGGRKINLNINCSFFNREHISGAGMIAW